MLKEEIIKLMYQSLKSGDKTKVKVLRFLISEIKYKEIDLKRDLNDEEIVTLLQKEIKKRQEAIVLFKKGQRQDLVIDEENQIKVIEQFLPEPLSDQEISLLIDKTIKEMGQSRNIGQVIGKVISQVKGRASGADIARLVKQKLAKN